MTGLRDGADPTAPRGGSTLTTTHASAFLAPACDGAEPAAARDGADRVPRASANLAPACDGSEPPAGRDGADRVPRASANLAPARDGADATSPGHPLGPTGAGPRAFIAPGATLGVVGGGQLGRMFAQAAQRAGYAVAVLDPDPAGPAAQVADRHVAGGYDDPAAIDALADGIAAATTEFENVPAATLDRLAARVPVAPAGRAVAVCQDRAAEKAAFVAAGLAVAPHAVLAGAAAVARAAADAGLFPGILKTARLGYDGKGQATVARGAELEAAFAALGGVPCVLERRLALAAEVSVIVARGADGAVVHLPVQQNVHADGVLAATLVPAAVPAALQAEAVALATRMAEALGYVGVLCLECFVVEQAGTLRLVANEMAPRPHNSGHHTIESCDVSQFELQWRALTGAPLVPPRLVAPAVLVNLLGDLWRDGEPDWAALLAIPGAHLHLYGKAEARPGRKMGHLTLTAPTAREAMAGARAAMRLLGLDPATLDRLRDVDRADAAAAVDRADPPVERIDRP